MVPTHASRRAALESAGEEQRRRFLDGAPVVDLVRERAKVVDTVVRELWQEHATGLVDVNGNNSSVAVVAVGGYGRGTLAPGSDITLRDVHLVVQHSPMRRMRWDVARLP